jgi:hypothetical protein
MAIDSNLLNFYLQGDPLKNVYNLDPSLIKGYTDDPIIETPKTSYSITKGYTRPYGKDEEIYIRDLDKFQRPSGPLHSELPSYFIDKENRDIAEVIGHESRHHLLADNPWSYQGMNSDLFTNREAVPGNPDRIELLNRMLDFQAYNNPGIYNNIYREMHGDMPRHLYSPIADTLSNRSTAFTRKMIMDRRATKKGIAQAVMQKKIQEAEAVKKKAAADAAAAQQVQQNIQTYGNRDRPNTGMNVPGGGKGQSPTGGDVVGTPFNSGGLVNFYRYGGFSG